MKSRLTNRIDRSNKSLPAEFEIVDTRTNADGEIVEVLLRREAMSNDFDGEGYPLARFENSDEYNAQTVDDWWPADEVFEVEEDDSYEREGGCAVVRGAA